MSNQIFSNWETRKTYTGPSPDVNNAQSLINLSLDVTTVVPKATVTPIPFPVLGAGNSNGHLDWDKPNERFICRSSGVYIFDLQVDFISEDTEGTFAVYFERQGHIIEYGTHTYSNDSGAVIIPAGAISMPTSQTFVLIPGEWIRILVIHSCPGANGEKTSVQGLGPEDTRPRTKITNIKVTKIY